MSGWTIGWLSIAAATAVLEGLALANRKRGDTLSEHVWMLLGVFPKPVCSQCGGPTKTKISMEDGWRVVGSPSCPLHPDAPAVTPPQSRRLPPAWVRIRRTVFMAFAAWLILHFTTGWV